MKTPIIHLLLTLFFLVVCSEATIGQINRYSKSSPTEFNLGGGNTALLLELLKAAEARKAEQEKEELRIKYEGKVHLYGGIGGHDTYLGCLNCPNYDPLSVWNPTGDYGHSTSRIWAESNIWNPQSFFGSSSGSYSPWSSYGTKPPVIVDFYGNFYGYFTKNQNIDKKTIYEVFNYITENNEFVRDHYLAFGRFFKEDGSFDIYGWNSYLEDQTSSYDSNSNSNSRNSSTYAKNPYEPDYSVSGNMVNATNVLYTATKSSGQLWREPISVNSIRPVVKGKRVTVLGYHSKGYWLVSVDGTRGYINNATIIETSEMSQLKRAVD